MAKEPDIERIQQDLNDYLSKKYGRKISFAHLDPIQEPAGEKVDDSEQKTKSQELVLDFSMKPQELKSYLDEYLVKQEEAKEVLATKICTHFNRIKRFELQQKQPHIESVGEIKNNVIMIGPTGVGKTFLIKLIARKIGVPFVKGDATKFSETGYVGGDVEDLVRDLVHEANGNIALAQFGIIYLDEVDKIASSPNLLGPDVSRSGVQRALLKPMEETEVDLKVPHDFVSQMEAVVEFQKTGKREKKKISTKHILFIMSGAFSGLEEIVRKRLHQQDLGFKAAIKLKHERIEYLHQVRAEDLIQYGFESEFIGRLPVITVFEHLEVEDLYRILCSPKNSIISGKKRDFKAYGIDLHFEDEALQLIAQNASLERTGARGLVSALERTLAKFEHVLPSTSIAYLVVTSAMVRNPGDELKKLLENPSAPQQKAHFERIKAQEETELQLYIHRKSTEYSEKYGLSLSEQRIRVITQRSIQERIDPEAIMMEMQIVYHALRTFENSFVEKNDITISFSDEACDWLIQKVWQDQVEPLAFLKQSYQNYEHGLKLIREKTGKDHFSIPPEGIEEPENFLNKLIREIYHD
ncbi:AAA family ATPase [candidate division CSSED10-310 bacterium]|uniref:AAA family ATPase n=1 Tax=candidate division CSSED10-310 bacterium TaxID=2855610 RepID=A0ABV6Z088_UNCC1